MQRKCLQYLTFLCIFIKDLDRSKVRYLYMHILIQQDVFWFQISAQGMKTHKKSVKNNIFPSDSMPCLWTKTSSCYLIKNPCLFLLLTKVIVQ